MVIPSYTPHPAGTPAWKIYAQRAKIITAVIFAVAFISLPILASVGIIR